ncbi:TPA: single-stranded DNA-binding protein [Legionella pneumophila]|jgi:single-strand DNA-binding protein|uniref:Single-stranded DNA-binding protein n=3 Tax=Legionella TaxID=445 RepID=A0A378J5U8_9GAMM|nr:MULTISPECIES: single-stranded DNA-binding protein [Legionellaceae]AGN13879.1 single-strand DNA-binding protein [Legionella pneumophila subsp. pneumophila str. Thunder Bay]AMP90321.1 single-stranded DNA-binding protein [Legionella pneumophila subsp. pascullei]AMP92012.1 single-stranded DNA-binding protein [Legionella pneumophila subsp. pascullei]AMP94977.1 single-stranded DNA-binding protein [Legionella pneumophila subsp. pascullei]ANH12405.1 single-stranded DNA-binding protein [Legionella p
MTASLNQVQLIGNLGADPKNITGKDGQSFVTATLATNESFKKNDEWQTRVEWHQLVLFGKLTKVAEYLKKGSQVYLEGKLRSNQWTDNEGKTHQTLSVVVNHIQLLSHFKSADESSNKTAEHHMVQMREMLQTDSEEIPF